MAEENVIAQRRGLCADSHAKFQGKMATLEERKRTLEMIRRSKMQKPTEQMEVGRLIIQRNTRCHQFIGQIK